MNISLDKVVPFGRSKREYELMFNLAGEDVSKGTLGCGDGPASFNAEATAEGYSVVSVDPLYVFTGDEIKRRFDESLDDVINQVNATPDRWVWTYHRDSEDLRKNRRRTMDLFLADYESGRMEGRFVAAALPRLPFTSQAFRLALCSHFLFLYSHLFSEEFHLESTVELCRVAQEVRIFPLLTLAHEISPHIEPVTKTLTSLGVKSSIETVEYELQRGGNQMLRLYRL